MEGFVYRAIVYRAIMSQNWLKLNTQRFTNNESLPQDHNNYLKNKEYWPRKYPQNSIINKIHSDNLHKSYKVKLRRTK
jgi:hypothetical protein